MIACPVTARAAVREQTLAFGDDKGPVLWLANLAPAPLDVAVKGLQDSEVVASHGDEATFTCLARYLLAMAPARSIPPR